MIADCDERPWWFFRLSDTATVHVPAETEGDAKRALRANALMSGKYLRAWHEQVDGLVGTSRWATRDSIRKGALRCSAKE